ncbi:hypothetical protein GC169_06125 [bacterium]|nr:hypothetical protein [bacterium]
MTASGRPGPPRTARLSTLLLFGVVYAALVFAVGFALGVVRVLVLAPAVGPLAAVAIELPFMLLASWVACAATERVARIGSREGQALVAGAIAFVMLLVMEAVLGAAMGRSLVAWLRDWLTPAGATGLVGQLLFALVPWIRARSRRRAPDA